MITRRIGERQWLLLTDCAKRKMNYLMAARVFDLAVSYFLGVLCVVFSDTEILQCLADAIATGESCKNRAGGDVRISSTKVCSQSCRGDVLTKFQIRICQQRRLISAPQIVRSCMQLRRHAGVIV